MAIEGVDYAWSRPGGAALAAAGKHFAARYMPYGGDGGKGLGNAELADLRAHGLSVVIVFETFADRALAGYAAGVNDALLSLQNLATFNFGPTFPVYFAVDIDATSSQLLQIDQYLKGAASVLGVNRVGVYGSYSVCFHCKQYGTARWFWQTYAWSYGALLTSAHLYQYQNSVHINGAEVDLTRALQADYGQWPRPVTIPDTAEPVPTTVHHGELPVIFKNRTGWKASIAKGKPRRKAAEAPSLALPNLGSTTRNEPFPIWGEQAGPAVGPSGSKRWLFGPQYVAGADHIVTIPLTDLIDRNFK